MRWVCRFVAAPLLLLALICAIGAVRIFSHDLPAESLGTGVFAAVGAVAAVGGAFLLLRPDLLLLRELTVDQLRAWALSNPLGQAASLYVLAAVLMVAIREYQLAPALLAMCIFSCASAWTSTLQQRWGLYAALSVLGWCALFLGLAATSEAIAPGGFGEGAMVFLLPMQVFPALLIVSGIVRLVRGYRPRQ